MSNIDAEIKDEILKDKFKIFYNKYRLYILISVFIIILTPIIFQIYIHNENTNRSSLISEYLKAEKMLDTKNNEAILILDKLKNSNNEIISILSLNKLLDYYLLNNKDKAINLLDNYKFSFKQSYLNELQNIKKAILNFDKINENQILNLLSTKESEKFKNIKKKLLYDFYIKNGQAKKAKQMYELNK